MYEIAVIFSNLLPGSGALVAPEAHSFWLGHPAHGVAFPACSLVVPGQSTRFKEIFLNFVFLSPIFNMVVNMEMRSYNDEKTFPEVIKSLRCHYKRQS